MDTILQFLTFSFINELYEHLNNTYIKLKTIKNIRKLQFHIGICI